MDNSTLLRPEGDDAPFSVINYVRLPGAAPPFAARQLVSPGFRRHVRPTIAEHGMTALPLFVRPA